MTTTTRLDQADIARNQPMPEHRHSFSTWHMIPFSPEFASAPSECRVCKCGHAEYRDIDNDDYEIKVLRAQLLQRMRQAARDRDLARYMTHLPLRFEG